MQLSLYSVTLKLNTLFKCPSCHTPSSLTSASMLLSKSSNLESLRSALNVCWRVEGILILRREMIDS